MTVTGAASAPALGAALVHRRCDKVRAGVCGECDLSGVDRPQEAPDFGIDAPGVVRNLFIAAALGLTLWGTSQYGLWSGTLTLPLPGVSLDFPLLGIGFWGGLSSFCMAIWMVWDSKVGKLRTRERLLDTIQWTGNERVLDVGCGRGLMLIGAARRLKGGRATGIDIWQSEDLSGNRQEATLENIRREGVAARADVETADMRKLPFAESSFDVVVSRAAIHNLYKAQDRAQAIGEIARVLKPGGYVVIDDIRHLTEYASAFTRCGIVNVRRSGSLVMCYFLAVITFGSLRPGVLIARKPL
jgi:arsenite methyltransferase